MIGAPDHSKKVEIMFPKISGLLMSALASLVKKVIRPTSIILASSVFM